MPEWWTWLPLVALSSLLGSAHCLGMCGPLALLVGRGCRSWGQNLRRQVAFSAGRVFTYAVLGALVAGAAQIASQRGQWLVYLPAVVSLAAGVFLIWQAIRWLQGQAITGSAASGSSLVAGLLGPVIRVQGNRSAFLAGVFTGFLPCGLVYAFLALAATTGNPFRGMALMLTFGLGTVPAMLGGGCGLFWLGGRWRMSVFRLAAVATLLVGLLALWRGATPLLYPAQAHQCPLCVFPWLEELPETLTPHGR